jgi:hypothetical protein
MADNVPITAGSGTNIATDDISGAHYQRMKLAVALADATAGIGHAEDVAHTTGDGGIMALAVRKDNPAALADADADYAPLEVDAVGRAWVRPAPVVTRIQVTPTISTSIYASGDVVGGSSNALEFANAVRVAGGSGMIQSILLLDKTAAVRQPFDLLFFDRQITAQADQAPVAISDADMAYCLGIVSIGAYNVAFPATALNSISTLTNVGLPIVCNGTSLYVVMVTRGTPTYVASSDLTLTLCILQD